MLGCCNHQLIIGKQILAAQDSLAKNICDEGRSSDQSTKEIWHWSFHELVLSRHERYAVLNIAGQVCSPCRSFAQKPCPNRMSVSKTQASILTAAYAALRRSGFLSSHIGQMLFARA